MFFSLALCVRRRFWGILGATRGSGGFFVPVSQILDKRRRIWYNGDDGGGPLCPPPNNIEQEENTMFQFEITGNVRNEQIILEDYNTQDGKKTKRAVITISTKTSGKFPSFLDIMVYGKLASNCAKYLKKGCVVTFHVKAASPKGHPYEYHFVGTEVGFQTDYSLPIPSAPDVVESISDIDDDVFADL